MNPVALYGTLHLDIRVKLITTAVGRDMSRSFGSFEVYYAGDDFADSKPSSGQPVQFGAALRQ